MSDETKTTETTTTRKRRKRRSMAPVRRPGLHGSMPPVRRSTSNRGTCWYYCQFNKHDKFFRRALRVGESECVRKCTEMGNIQGCCDFFWTHILWMYTKSPSDLSTRNIFGADKILTADLSSSLGWASGRTVTRKISFSQQSKGYLGR